MAPWNSYNPFSKREAHGRGAVAAYRALTLLSWLLSVAATVHYGLHRPRDGPGPRRRIWDQDAAHPSAFSLNPALGDVYWVGLFLLQLAYVGHLFSRRADSVHAAASVGSHFVVNNLLHFAFVMLLVRSLFAWAELVLVVNLANLAALYLRHHSYARLIHAPAVSAPLAWTYVALFWNGAMMVPHRETLVARVLGNVFVWSILGFGLFFVVGFKDYTMGFALSVLTAALGVAQLERQVVALQWIFAFVIMAVLFVATLVVALPAWAGRDLRWRRIPVADEERAPLLNE